MAEKLKLCLVGPRGAGKSSLVASLADCVLQSAYGYPPQLRAALQPISRIEYEEASAAASRFELLENLVSDYERLRAEFAAGGAPTAASEVFDYHFRLTLDGEGAEANRTPRLLEISDASGDLCAPSLASRPLSFTLKEKFAAKLLGADAILLVLPLARLSDCAWSGDIARLLERLAQARERKATRFIVAFSKYERLFVPFGPSAFTFACDPAVALHVARKAAQSAPWLNVLRRLDGGESDAKTRFTVVSAFGFVKNFQNPNIDPHQPGERRFRRDGLEGAQAHREFWRPFLTAEPILEAALGHGSAFTFSFAQLDGTDARQEDA
ncbi:MAG TPA: hypothetical protein VK446_16465 [Methylocystis sp.]|nr:hypothetical protein [Methylocystis sp.]